MPVLRDSEVSEGQLPREFWNWFWTAHPGFQAVVHVSRVGFSSDRTEALVYVSVGCGAFCGHGELVRLSRRDGKWVIAERRTTVVM
jgi:hypothetical protein